MSYSNIKNQINKIKNNNVEIGNQLMNQFNDLSSADYAFEEAENLVKCINDVADNNFNELDSQHQIIREIQDEMINFFTI